MRVMVLGITGMLGNAMFRVLADAKDLAVLGTARDENSRRYFSGEKSDQIITGVDVESLDSLVRAFAVAQPDVVINCIGLVKQLAEANDPLLAVPINTLLPHRLAALCKVSGARLIHISTDCVFSGAKGDYVETDFPDARDLYGRTKFLGEVDYPHAITLRTSIIGHELVGHRSLVGWFLSQQGQVKGFTRAFFSGLPTVELASVVRDFVLGHPELSGVYHVASRSISKFNLLQLIDKEYGKNIEIIPSEHLTIDRSLNSERFMRATGYVAPEWPVLVKRMSEFK